jgi:hypothetical protein
VGDAGGELAERGELLGLNEPVLGGAQLLQRSRQFAGACFDAFVQPRVMNGHRRLRGERLHQVNGTWRKRARRAASHHQHADDVVAAE